MRSLSEQLLKTSHLGVRIALIADALIDIAVFAICCVTALAPSVLIPIGFAIVFDLAMIVYTFLANFSFTYVRFPVLGYLILSVIDLTLMTYFSAFDSHAVVMSYVSVGILLGVHVFTLLLFLINFLLISRRTSARRRNAITCLCAFLLAGGYGVAAYTLGCLGQSWFSRAIVYELNSDNTYTVKNVEYGIGNKVNIPAKFNGLDVTNVSYELLTNDTISYVNIENRPLDVRFTDYSDTLAINKDITITLPKENTDSVRQQMVHDILSGETVNENALNVLNHTLPNSLTGDECFLSVSYTPETLSYIGDNYLPVFYFNKGDTITTRFLNEFDFGRYADNHSYDNYRWCYENRPDKSILVDVKDADGNSVLNQKIEDNLSDITLEFDTVYQVRIMDDNDTMYETPEDKKYTFENGVFKGEEIYTLRKNAQSILDNIPRRDGFELQFLYKGNEVTDFAQTINDSMESSFEITPKWTLNAPKNLTLSLKDDVTAYTYGDTATLEVSYDAEGVSSGVQYTCEIILYTPDSQFKQEVQNETGSYACDYDYSYLSKKGTYRFEVKITAHSDRNTSLTSETTSSLSFDVNVKDITLTWSSPSNMAYDGNVKKITCAVDASQLVGTDDPVINVTLDGEGIHAGDYTATAAFKNTVFSNKYNITNPSYDYTILQRSLTLYWSDEDFVYDGEEHYHQVIAFDNLASADKSKDVIANITYSNNHNSNAGTYTVTATLNNSDYQITDGSDQNDVTISKKSVTVTLSEGGSREYDGNVKTTGYGNDGGTGWADGESMADYGSLSFSGSATTNKDAGTYTLSAEFVYDTGAVQNYKVTIAGSVSYTIEAKTISFTWNTTTEFDYDGSEHCPSATANADDIIDGDIVNVIVSGGQTEAGTYTATVTGLDNANYQLDSSSDLTITFTIKEATPDTESIGLLPIFDKEREF